MTGTIEGTISDDEDNGIEDATITVTDAATEKLEATTTTNETGEYSVSVAPDTYDVQAEKIGFAADDERVTVGPGVTKTVNLTLVELTPDVIGKITDGPGIGVLGTVTDDRGLSIGVQGEVAADAGYGLYTPNDARIDGVVDTVEEWQVTIDGERTLRLAVSEEIEVPRKNYTGSGSIVMGHFNDVAPRVVGAVISGGGLYDGDDDERLGNFVTDHLGTIGGGFDNRAGNDDNDPWSAARATVGGGQGNKASGFEATVAGGSQNTASDRSATIGGGRDNEASDTRATVSGGTRNIASGRDTTVGGGFGNRASDNRATVSGGLNNLAGNDDDTGSGGVATVGGGFNNEASGSSTTIGGGSSNEASGRAAMVGGGGQNTASGSETTVSGGSNNEASGFRATVPGGSHNTSNGDYSFAAGRAAKADHDGAFVWADSNSSTFVSSSDNQFLVEATGGVGFGTDSPGSQLHVVDNLGKNIADPAGHVATFENVNKTISADVLALKVGNSTPGGANNYVTFLDGDNDMVGEIDGNGSGGVSYKSSSSDFAEYFPKANSDDSFAPGTVVCLRAGELTRDLDGAHAAFAITETPIVVGNQPPTGEKDNFAAVALVGQVPVRVRGPVEAGDLLVAAGDGIAVSADTEANASLVVGRALESLGADRGEIKTFVDRVGSTVSSVASEGDETKQLREHPVTKDERIEALERQNAELAERLAAVEAHVGVHEAPSTDH